MSTSHPAPPPPPNPAQPPPKHFPGQHPVIAVPAVDPGSLRQHGRPDCAREEDGRVSARPSSGEDAHIFREAGLLRRGVGGRVHAVCAVCVFQAQGEFFSLKEGHVSRFVLLCLLIWFLLFQSGCFIWFSFGVILVMLVFGLSSPVFFRPKVR